MGPKWVILGGSRDGCYTKRGVKISAHFWNTKMSTNVHAVSTLTPYYIAPEHPRHNMVACNICNIYMPHLWAVMCVMHACHHYV